MNSLMSLPWIMLAAAMLAGCGSIAPAPTPGSAEAPVAMRWHAPLAHEGTLDELTRWWAQFDDPLMLDLIADGQYASATLAQAFGRIADAQAARVGGIAALLPSLDGVVDASRGRSELGAPVSSLSLASLQASWELDLFGANRAGASAAQAQLEARMAGWHDARVSLAAEVATTYIELRACEAQVAQAEHDAESRRETARLTELMAGSGFQAPAEADLARASAAQGQVTLAEQRAQCEYLVKSLVALTARAEPALREQLADATAHLPQPAEFRVASVPAQVLAQRPDLYAAARDVVAASAESVQAQALRWPRVTLSGNIGSTRIAEEGGVSSNGTVWRVGPVAVTLPLFDGGTRRANAEAAKVRYEVATVVYAERLRNAIREVETALVTLQSTTVRSDDARRAVEGFERSYRAVESRYRVGNASLFELEDARRSRVAAQVTLIDLQRERVASWITLYRAVGGGWSAAELNEIGGV
ncbi:efflux transporter outer membrane subunit [Pseudomonas sp. EA_35y_Pfl2_R111]|uniref:efflux transporter outer membrane subunit n=1 Tax=Pseudomonas sp. EA_35y_Pfl2_R111 TaxID=3088689 RepID=UPI0030DA4897